MKSQRKPPACTLRCLVHGLFYIIPFCVAELYAAVTTPTGFTTIIIKPGHPTTPTRQFLGFGLSKPTAFQARISSVATISGSQGAVTRLQFPVNSFPSGQFGPGANGPTHFAEILGGAFEGIVSPITETVANAVVLSDEIIGLTSGTVSARIRAFWTPGELFGTGVGNVGFSTGNETTADIIRILPAGTAPIEIYNDGSNWRFASGGANANNFPIPITAGIEVLRRGTTEFSFRIVGEVKTGSTQFAVTSGTTFLQNVYPLRSMRLKDLGLYTGNPNTGLRAGTHLGNADHVTIEDQTNGERIVCYVDQSSGRFTTGSTDASLIQIPAHSTLAITRSGTLPRFFWNCPQPIMALGEGPLPVSLVAAASRKAHDGKSYDVHLPISGLAVEPRQGSNVTLVFTFSGASDTNPLTSGSASVTSPFGASIASTQTVADEFRVNLTSVASVQTVSVTISNVQAQNGQIFSGPATVNVGMLLGDVSNNKVVNVGDSVLAQQATIQGGTVRFSNFRADIDTSGTVAPNDVATVRQQSGEGL